MNAIQLQWEYLERAKKYVEHEDPTGDNPEVVERWEAVLTALEDDPLQLHRELDWVAKFRILEGYASATASTGTTTSCGSSTCSTTTSGATRGCTTVSSPAGRSTGSSPTTRLNAP